jgi:RNase P/RNase MRP subunit p30
MKYADLVFPGNEQALAKELQELGFKQAIFCYTDPKAAPKLPDWAKSAFLLKDRKSIPKLKKQFDLLVGQPTREFFEDKRVDLIFGPGKEPRKDSMHYRRSLTQVEATLAKQHGKTVLFNLADLLSEKRPQRKAELLGRWAQDKRVLKKRGAKFLLVSGAKERFGLRARKDLEAFWQAI